MTNRLTGTASSTFAFDPSGRLSSRTTGGSGERYLYAGNQLIAAYDAGGTLLMRYVPGAGLDDYAAYVSPGKTRPNGRAYPLADQLGSILTASDGSGAAGTINTYDEYGVPGSGNAGRFGYAGSIFLPQSQGAPWHMRNRQYYPGLGRFLQTDPIGIAGGVNLYAYTVNDPISRLDPFGAQSCTVWMCSDDQVEDVTVTGTRIRCPENSYCSRDEIDRILEWIDSMNMNDRRFHDEQTFSWVCVEGSRSCTPERVRQCLLRYPAPGASGSRPVRSGDLTHVDLRISGVGVEGDVVHAVTESGVINVTLPNHTLYPGVAIRSVRTQDVWGITVIGINTRSIGTGAYATANENGTVPLWAGMSALVSLCVATEQ